MVPGRDLSTLVITFSVWEYRSSRKVVLHVGLRTLCVPILKPIGAAEWNGNGSRDQKEGMLLLSKCHMYMCARSHSMRSLCGSMCVNICTE